MVDAFIALGSNLGDRLSYLRRALNGLQREDGIAVVALSRVYETKPMGLTHQPDFYNMVIQVKTRLVPADLLSVCMQIEKENGRLRTLRWGPRTLDLDILLYGSEVIEEPNLIIPHPRMHDRAFVLLPLCDLAPERIHPVLGRPFRELAREVQGKEGVVPCTTIHWPAVSEPSGNSKD